MDIMDYKCSVVIMAVPDIDYNSRFVITQIGPLITGLTEHDSLYSIEV